MAKVVCNRDKNEYPSADGRTCCARCPAGKYVHRDCDSIRATECAECGRELFTETINFLHKCITCRQCYHLHREVRSCLAHENRQCECITGFYCHQPGCEQCIQVTPCPVGQGVKVKATATNDTVCAPCESRTYSNVSDHTSPCKPHTSCADQGKELKMPGTHSVDAICGPFQSGCSWELPAGLWSGLVLTSILIFLGLIFWRTRHRSRKTVFSSVPTGPAVSVSPPVARFNPPAPPTDIHCQESCGRCTDITVDCNCCVPDHMGYGLDTAHPEPTRAPNPAHCDAKAPNGRPENLQETSLCRHAEPQEDEWCGK